MSERTRRRSAERAARKSQPNSQLLAPQTVPVVPAKSLSATASASRDSTPNHQPDEREPWVFHDDPDPADSRASAGRIAANQANALKSTGPVSLSGKAISCLNAVKHGLTGSTVLLDADDADAYQQRLNAHVEQFKPVTFEERRLVQSIHDAAWRLDRILNLESTIYAKGRYELDCCFVDLPEDQRKSFIQLETSQRCAKELRNLHVQEGRLQGQRARDIKALNLLLQQRLAAEAESHSDTPEVASSRSVPRPLPHRDPLIGFVFTDPDSTPKKPADSPA